MAAIKVQFYYLEKLVAFIFNAISKDISQDETNVSIFFTVQINLGEYARCWPFEIHYFIH